MKSIYQEIKTYNNQPEYYVSFKSFMTSFEIYVNDSPIFSYYSAGGIDDVFEINTEILEKGIQHLKVVMLPAAVTGRRAFYDAMHSNAFIEVAVMKTADNDDDIELMRVTSPNINPKKGVEYPVKFPHKGKPEFIMEGTFNAPDIPYELEGWKNSKDLTKEDPDKLLKEVVAKYEQLRQIFEDKDYEALSKELYKRELEVCQSLYYEKEDIEDRVQRKKEGFERENYKVVDSNRINQLKICTKFIR